MRGLLLSLVLGIPALSVAEPEGARFYLLQYTPGPNWNSSVTFSDQPGIKAHKAYLEDLYRNDLVRMAGETEAGPGAVVLLRVSSRDQASAVATLDPAVINRILDVEVVGWRVDMSSMRHQRRVQQPVRDPDQPFRIERLDPDSPINLKNPSPPR